MKTSEIAYTYSIDKERFETFLMEIGAGQIERNSFTGEKEIYLDDYHIPVYLEKFKEWVTPILEAEAEAEAEAKKQRELAEAEAKKQRELAEAEKQRACANMLITSGFNFDGYRITKYSGYISGDDAIQISRGTDGIFSSATDVGQALTDSLVKIRRQALKELKEAAYDLGFNAVVGVDFDYITLEPETANSRGGTTYLPYVFCVTANGNAVVIEKDDSK